MNHFFINNTGELMYIKDMPVEPKPEKYFNVNIPVGEKWTDKDIEGYKQYGHDLFVTYDNALQSAKEGAIRVKNPDALGFAWGEDYNTFFINDEEYNRREIAITDQYKVEILEEPEEDSGTDDMGRKVDFQELAIVSHVESKKCNQNCTGSWDCPCHDKEESQEELWAKVINDARFYDGSPNSLHQLTKFFQKQGFTLTRKPQWP